MRVAVSPTETGPLPTMVLPVCGFGAQPSAFTHWSIPSITDRVSNGFSFFTPANRAMGSSTLWNSRVGTGRDGWMVGISTWPSIDEMAAKCFDASAAKA